MIGTSNTWRRSRTLGSVVRLVSAVVAVAVVAACDDDDDVTAPALTKVAVFSDASVNFGALRTFAMPDTVVQFAPLTGTPIAVSRQFDATILNQVRLDFISRGYTQVTPSATLRPDFVVLVGTTATQNYNAYVGYPWYSTWGFYSGWGWYAPGFTSSWSVVYPWYATVGVTAYDRGSLLVDLIPTLSVNPLAQTVRSAWVGAATTLLNGAVTTTSITTAIDSMFTLSPYLSASP